MKINLPSIIKNQITAKLLFETGFNTKTGIHIPQGSHYLFIYKNNLRGGYIGNTLLRKSENWQDADTLQNIDVRIGEFLFSRCQIQIELNGDRYILNSNYNYLRLNAEIIK
jgi:hypothetical protein